MKERTSASPQHALKTGSCDEKMVAQKSNFTAVTYKIQTSGFPRPGCVPCAVDTSYGKIPQGADRTYCRSLAWSDGRARKKRKRHKGGKRRQQHEANNGTPPPTPPEFFARHRRNPPPPPLGKLTITAFRFTLLLRVWWVAPRNSPN